MTHARSRNTTSRRDWIRATDRRSSRAESSTQSKATTIVPSGITIRPSSSIRKMPAPSSGGRRAMRRRAISNGPFAIATRRSRSIPRTTSAFTRAAGITASWATTITRCRTSSELLNSIRRATLHFGRLALRIIVRANSRARQPTTTRRSASNPMMAVCSFIAVTPRRRWETTTRRSPITRRLSGWISSSQWPSMDARSRTAITGSTISRSRTTMPRCKPDPIGPSRSTVAASQNSNGVIPTATPISLRRLRLMRTLPGSSRAGVAGPKIVTEAGIGAKQPDAGGGDQR
jgi:hypothetical protein